MNPRLGGKYIYLRGSQWIDYAQMYKVYGSMLAHELSHMLYTNYTRVYTTSWFGNTSTYGFSRNAALTEALAYFTGSVYYPPTQYKMTASTIYNNVKGYVDLVEKAAYRYYTSGFTSKDWYLFHAWGYFLYNTGKVGELIWRVRYYVSTGNANVFKSAYEATYKKIWSDTIAASSQMWNPNYLYYSFYQAWIK